MRALFIALWMAFLAGHAVADLVLKGDDGARIVLQETQPCKVAELLDGVALDLIAHIHGGVLHMADGTIRRLCWARNGQWALIKDESGAGGIVDLSKFSPGI